QLREWLRNSLNDVYVANANTNDESAEAAERELDAKVDRVLSKTDISIFEEIRRRKELEAQKEIEVEKEEESNPIKPLGKTIWFKIASIAAVLLIAFAILYTQPWKTNETPEQSLANNYGEEALPGSNRATLTLADGSTINLS